MQVLQEEWDPGFSDASRVPARTLGPSGRRAQEPAGFDIASTGEVLRPGQSRHPAGGQAGGRQTPAQAHPRFRPRACSTALVGPTTKGTPQGGPLSPLLSNLAGCPGQGAGEARPPLRPLRRRLQPLRAVPAGGRAGHGERDQLPRPAAEADGNAAKSAVDRPSARAFLAFSHTNAPALEKLRVRELRSRGGAVPLPRRVAGLLRILRGPLCPAPPRPVDTAAASSSGSTGSARFAALRRRGVSKTLAAKTASSAHGPWRVSLSPALCIALPNAFFDRLGLASVAAGHAA